MRIGIVSPYSYDVPGGVQFHIRDLAETLIAAGHHVQVLGPASETADLPSYVTGIAGSVAVPYNGSVARLAFGPLAATRVRRWVKAGDFDVIHVHEPMTPSLSFLAVLMASCPVVATFHTAMTRSRTLAAGRGLAQLVLEKISARIAVSALARKVQVEHLGGGAVEIPNGVLISAYRTASPLPERKPDGHTLGFLGRFDEPRKGFGLLREAFAQLAPERPELKLVVAGKGDHKAAVEGLPADVAARIEFLGMVSDEEKARMLRSIDIYVAPNTGGESFGMILVEAMAARACVLASNLEAFRLVVDDGRAGALFTNGDADNLAKHIRGLLDDPQMRAQYVSYADEWVKRFDWPVVATQITEVYRAAIDADSSPAA
ncbi:glycosyltransferase family 4 protein [Natronoglycomyces albus]|uniref:Glycosyltransferase family 4 protein n=1 Tax=Natronoglycomyces albus TaxID=2811108 RepID=A0A895XTP2_9ACTN|nr:glycosyltransferase family 4 protein [Natronoglycomyces albus]